jgi:hypothetical protein
MEARRDAMRRDYLRVHSEAGITNAIRNPGD